MADGCCCKPANDPVGSIIPASGVMAPMPPCNGDKEAAGARGDKEAPGVRDDIGIAGDIPNITGDISGDKLDIGGDTPDIGGDMAGNMPGQHNYIIILMYSTQIGTYLAWGMTWQVTTQAWLVIYPSWVVVSQHPVTRLDHMKERPSCSLQTHLQ